MQNKFRAHEALCNSCFNLLGLMKHCVIRVSKFSALSTFSIEKKNPTHKESQSTELSVKTESSVLYDSLCVLDGQCNHGRQQCCPL